MERDDRNPEELGACGGTPETSSVRKTDNGTAVFTDQETYLNGIHTKFLDKVMPEESGILDVLREAEVLSSEDEQSIAGGNTRREKARRLLKVLHRIPEEDFVDSFLPKFKEEYPHVVAGREFKLMGPSAVRCLRHAIIKRLNLKRLVDILPALKCCTQDQYNQLQAVEHCGEKEWTPVFQLLQENASNAQLCQEVQKLLLRKKISQLQSYHLVATGGFLCTCNAPSPVSAPLVPETLPKQNQEGFKGRFSALGLHDGGSSNPYPSTPPSSQKSLGSYDPDACSDRADSGIMSISMDDMLVQPALDQDLFQTVEDKERYMLVLDRINNAITTATTTRTDLRHMEMIRDRARSRAKPAKDEAVSEENGRSLQELKENAEYHCSRVEELNQQVLHAWKLVENTFNFEFALPSGWQRLLMIRYHLLHNEVTECKHVAETAKNILEEISKSCLQNPQ